MGWFSKKEEVPEIAPAPILPELPRKEVEPVTKDLPELPSFPNTSINENLNQEMVKSAVTDNLSPWENEVTEVPMNLQITEVPQEEFKIPPRPPVVSPIPGLPRVTVQKLQQLPAAQTSPIHQKMTLELNATKKDKPITKPLEPIYIRIDKFQSAQKNFEQVKEKVGEIESLLKKVKDIKSQEEIELNGWAEDIEKIKARLAEVDSDIFDQI